MHYQVLNRNWKELNFWINTGTDSDARKKLLMGNKTLLCISKHIYGKFFPPTIGIPVFKLTSTGILLFKLNKIKPLLAGLSVPRQFLSRDLGCQLNLRVESLLLLPKITINYFFLVNTVQ
jgi:hypothetical protein